MLNVANFQAYIERARAERDALYDERAERERDIMLIDAKAAKWQSLIDALTALVEEAGEMPGGAESEQRVPELDDESELPEEFTLGDIVALDGVPREGYGAFTKGVAALLGSAYPGGYTTRELVTRLEAARFVVDAEGGYDSAVRSAIRNLRNQKKIGFDEAAGKYRLLDAPAAIGPQP